MDFFTQFGFFTESLGHWDWVFACDFALKCYNLFLLYFYFEIAKFIVCYTQKIIRRFKRATD